MTTRDADTSRRARRVEFTQTWDGMTRESAVAAALQDSIQLQRSSKALCSYSQHLREVSRNLRCANLNREVGQSDG